MGCCNGRSWKREEKKDHRFDYLEMQEFRTNAIGCRVGHFYLWISIIRAFVILALDIYTAVGLLVLKSYQTTVTQQTFIAHSITKWIFAGCIILSVVLLIWDWIFAIRIIRSKNISFAFTNVIANRVYSMRSYDHHCLFYRLSSSSHKSNNVAFWVFFSFQGWKRLVLTEGPRQVINALTVFSVLSTRNFSFQASAYANITIYQWTVLSIMSLSLLIWLFSFVRFCLAALIFLPLLCHIQGGLTEFVVRKIDKRIESIIEKARRKRLDRYAQARKKEASKDASAPKKSGSSKSGSHDRGSVLVEMPTLPSIPLIREDEEKETMHGTSYAVGSDTDSIYSINSTSKSAMPYSATVYALPRSETLPVYRSSSPEPHTALDSLQTEPTLPAFIVEDSATYRSQDTVQPVAGQVRPRVQPAPSYHRQQSYESLSATSRLDDPAAYQRPLQGRRRAPDQMARVPSNRSLTDPERLNQYNLSVSTRSDNSLHSTRSAQTRPGQRTRPRQDFA